MCVFPVVALVSGFSPSQGFLSACNCVDIQRSYLHAVHVVIECEAVSFACGWPQHRAVQNGFVILPHQIIFQIDVVTLKKKRSKILTYSSFISLSSILKSIFKNFLKIQS